MDRISKKKMSTIMQKLKLNEQGLIPAIAQDVDSGEVLMLAWMNEESLRLTLETRLCHYFSRSRQKLWKKGETSQCLQHLQWIRYDCDGDVILLGIKQDGAACHTGERSCFFRDLEEDEEKKI
jgi:phosphoribosyl-AMP cyclohydrolase